MCTQTELRIMCFLIEFVSMTPIDTIYEQLALAKDRKIVAPELPVGDVIRCIELGWRVQLGLDALKTKKSMQTTQKQSVNELRWGTVIKHVPPKFEEIEHKGKCEITVADKSFLTPVCSANEKDEQFKQTAIRYADRKKSAHHFILAAP